MRSAPSRSSSSTIPKPFYPNRTDLTRNNHDCPNLSHQGSLFIACNLLTEHTPRTIYETRHEKVFHFCSSVHCDLLAVLDSLRRERLASVARAQARWHLPR